MSFRIRPIYPYRVWVATGTLESSMTEAGNANANGASKGCGCAPKAAVVPSEETARMGCCGGGHDPLGQGHGDHHGADLTKSKAAAPEGTIYTCPMHPQIRQIGPGSCPICGMALEPDLAAGDTEPNTELTDMTRRFWIGLILTLPVFGLEMGSHLFDIHRLIDQSLSGYIQFT